MKDDKEDDTDEDPAEKNIKINVNKTEVLN
jgi:hypothetical protein